MTIEQISAPPVSTVSPESAMSEAEVTATNENVGTPIPPEAPAPAPAPAPAAPVQNDTGLDAMKAQIAELRSQLQSADIRSALAERRLTPQDNDLVVRMITEKMSDGMDADKACAALYKSHPYLFKPVPQTKAQTDAAEQAELKSLNDAYVNGVIGRLKRGAISIGG